MPNTASRSYAGAAIGAFEKGLLQQKSLLRVGQACVREFGTVKFATAKAKMIQQAEIMKDVSALQKLLDPEDSPRNQRRAREKCENLCYREF